MGILLLLAWYEEINVAVLGANGHAFYHAVEP
jgi:hypothetical protein